jgi:hypothetical protein
VAISANVTACESEQLRAVFDWAWSIPANSFVPTFDHLSANRADISIRAERFHKFGNRKSRFVSAVSAEKR